MNICIYGAGAVGSLFGAILSKNNTVSCIARKQHVQQIRKHGLMIMGKTQFQGNIPFYETLDELKETPDIILITVKAYDTTNAAQDIAQIISKNTIVLTLQNGLENIEKIVKIVPEKQVLAGITSHGSIFLQSGLIKHTGIGKTRIGELDGRLSTRLRNLQTVFIQSGLPVEMSTNIKKDIWKKVIVNASINPLTTIFQCKNGYLLENPILKNLVGKICMESTLIAHACEYQLDINEMINYTYEVIKDTYGNVSSMLQSIHQKKKTEINEINGAILRNGLKSNCTVDLNEMATHIIPMMYP
jgi:2-dehydropantoate 2-reductase